MSERPTGLLPGAVPLGLARTGIELKEFFRLRETVVFTFSFPVILLFVFGSVFDDDLAPGVSFTQYFTAGMIASGIVLSSFQTLAIGIAIERDDGTLKRLRGTPMPPVAYFLGKIGLVLVTSVVQTAVLLLLGTLMMGLDLPSTPGLWLRFTWIFLLGTASGTVLGIAYSSLARSSKTAAAVVSPVVILLQFISGVFFVFTDLPSWMQAIGSVFPLRWLSQGMRSVFLPEDFAAAEAGGSWQLGLTALVLTGWLVAGTLLALKTFRWQRHDAR
ncbi:ABC transporter permease [Kineosporia sp. J2-2]|uniref:Transport permease protein n=1 Tax=Kineosporia corallincola TaxID=2835133 RepID=A0ABS5TDY2_9ACTN|nr:ABC transporter permease [Kineosporia corallincola]MBT0767829.1 ABC transporter permease [Kineosporia corallincola]